MRSLGRDPNEALDLLQSLEINALKGQEEGGSGQINFEDFLKLMKNLENRLL